MTSKLDEVDALLKSVATSSVAKLEIGLAIVEIAYTRPDAAARELAKAIEKDPRNEVISRAAQILDEYREARPFYSKPISQWFRKSK